MLRDLNFKEFLLGKTLPTSAHAEERLSNTAALALNSGMRGRASWLINSGWIV